MILIKKDRACVLIVCVSAELFVQAYFYSEGFKDLTAFITYPHNYIIMATVNITVNCSRDVEGIVNHRHQSI